MSDIALAAPTRRQTIGKLPINLFASVMGLTGLALAWREAAHNFGIAPQVGEAIGWLAVATFLALAVGYGSKLLQHPDLVAAEFTQPVMGNFFAMTTVSLLLLSGFLKPYAVQVGQAVWMLGTAGAVTVAYIMIRRFLIVRQDPATSLPQILLPVVALLDIPATSAAMPFAWVHEINLLAMAVGCVIALSFLPLVFHRLRHQDPLPLAMRPALMVLVAPFAVGFLAYSNLSGDVGPVAGGLFYGALFFFVLIAPQIFRRDVPFGVGWWAVSFPMAALSIAAFKYAAAVGGMVLQGIAALLFIALAVVILGLFVRTLVILLNGTLLRAET